MAEGPPIDWIAVWKASESGHLMELLATLPRKRWAERDEHDRTLLHFACCGPNVPAIVALLQSKLVDMNARNHWKRTAALRSASIGQLRALELLCVAGADLRASDWDGLCPIDIALCNAAHEGSQTLYALVANGVRLSTVRERYREYLKPEHSAFEYGVLRCRTAVVAMLRVKKAGQLWQWDKFLLREMAYAVWATRYEEEWQN